MDKTLLERFTVDFEKNLSNNLSRVETFEKATEDFQKVCGFIPYAHYKSYYQCMRQERLKKKAKVEPI